MENIKKHIIWITIVVWSIYSLKYYLAFNSTTAGHFCLFYAAVLVLPKPPKTQ